MCMMCMILSPNCCTVTIFEYSSTDVTLLPSCLSVLSEHVASQSKWRSADLDLLKLAKKRKSVCSSLFRGNVCNWSEVYSKVESEPKHEVTTIEQEVKIKKKNGLFCFG